MAGSQRMRLQLAVTCNNIHSVSRFVAMMPRAVVAVAFSSLLSRLFLRYFSDTQICALTVCLIRMRYTSTDGVAVGSAFIFSIWSVHVCVCGASACLFEMVPRNPFNGKHRMPKTNRTASSDTSEEHEYREREREMGNIPRAETGYKILTAARYISANN